MVSPKMKDVIQNTNVVDMLQLSDFYWNEEQSRISKAHQEHRH